MFIADYVLMGYGTGAIMAVPGAGHPGLGLRHRVRPADHPHRAAAADHPEDEAFTGEGPAINSANDEIS